MGKAEGKCDGNSTTSGATNIAPEGQPVGSLKISSPNGNLYVPNSEEYQIK